MYPKYFEISLRSPFPVWSVDTFLHFVNNRGSGPANLNSGQEFGIFIPILDWRIPENYRRQAHKVKIILSVVLTIIFFV